MNEAHQIIIYFILKALLITIIIELLVLVVLREKNYKVYILSVFLNLFTNLSLNVGIQFVNPKSYFLVVGILEVLIVLIEACGYNIIYKNYKKSLQVAVSCNIMSFLLGFIFL